MLLRFDAHYYACCHRPPSPLRWLPLVGFLFRCFSSLIFSLDIATLLPLPFIIFDVIFRLRHAIAFAFDAFFLRSFSLMPFSLSAFATLAPEMLILPHADLSIFSHYAAAFAFFSLFLYFDAATLIFILLMIFAFHCRFSIFSPSRRRHYAHTLRHAATCCCAMLIAVTMPRPPDIFHAFSPSMLACCRRHCYYFAFSRHTFH